MRVSLFLMLILTLIIRQAITKEWCSIKNCLLCSQDESRCIECENQFHLSNNGLNCKRCSINCQSCTESKCIQCKKEFTQDENDLTQCIKHSFNSEYKNKSMSRKLDEEQIVIDSGCHYTCQKCLQKGQESFCTSCPKSRYLDQFQGHDYGRCLCISQGQIDTGTSECQDSGFGIDSFNILSYVIQGLFIPTVILTSIAGANGTFLFLLVETAQSYNMLLYLNSHNLGNMDQFLESFKFSHLDKYFPPIINSVYKYFYKQQPINGNPKILFDSYNSDNTLTNNWMYLSLMTLFAIITCILNKIKPDYSSNQQVIVKWTSYMTFSLPLIYFYTTFQSIMMQTIYTFSCFNDTNKLSQAGLAFSFLQFFYMIGVAIFLCFIIVKQIKNKWFYLFNHVLQNEKTSQRLFIVWQFLKKILVASIVVGIYYSSTTQATLLFLIQIINELYIQLFKPLQNQDKLIRRKFIIAHQIILVLVHFLFVFKQSTVFSFGFDMFIAVLIIIDLLLVSIKGISISIRDLRKIIVQSFYELQNEEVVIKPEQVTIQPSLEITNLSINMSQQQKEKSISVFSEKQVNNLETNQLNQS
ncbi:transmembrane protein, putative (macronuclear) [Tetrahymena thermophila SB210]|uniref:Transmembrane protein, putative n=1 Tax=Tetrahymena thermophila (strain SB210) TaxID=312017 RepID=W7XDK3_TETTS|nr:transmembrane protein, putative [Tetrahymena thermophila SB210]EWS74723.1 transmembrane protein, putative [Tetrahymena thermophila SB210]|eukprot:XP_012652724.1 transmembrane protein, putative [Tetrahymena thermophila SB210]